MTKSNRDQDVIMQKAIAARIKAYREASAKTINEFAEYMGISAAMIRKIENGDSGFYAHKALRIANFLNIPVTTLLAAENTDIEPVILRKNYITTARKLAQISDPALRKNLTEIISKLSNG